MTLPTRTIVHQTEDQYAYLDHARRGTSMDATSVKGTEFGGIVRARREGNGLDLAQLCEAIGGTPGAAFLARMEEGAVGPTSSLVVKLAVALELPADKMLNAAGFATNRQRIEALASLGREAQTPAFGAGDGRATRT